MRSGLHGRGHLVNKSFFGSRVSWRPLFILLRWPNNQVTLSRALIIAVLVLPMFVGMRWPPAAASAIFMTGFWLFDQLDGWLARRLGRSSSFGESLDLLVDRFCDVLIAAYLLTAEPQHVAATLVFLLLRIAPDVLVARFAGLSPNMFATVLRQTIPARTGLETRLVSWSLEANSLTKSGFFCAALFWSSPAWTGLLIAIPAFLFAAMVLLVMREHARRVLAERGEQST
jgi:phosphatidylglycerophosphate synthase